MYVYMCVSVYVCECVYVRMYVYARVCIFARVCIVYVCACACTCVCVCLCTYVCACVCTRVGRQFFLHFRLSWREENYFCFRRNSSDRRMDVFLALRIPITLLQFVVTLDHNQQKQF